MSVSTLSVSDKLSPKKTKAQPHLVVFADSDAKILGNLDSGHLDRAKALIKASGFKGSVGENVTDYGIDDGHVISVIGTGSLDKLAGQMPNWVKPPLTPSKTANLRSWHGAMSFAKSTLDSLSMPYCMPNTALNPTNPKKATKSPYLLLNLSTPKTPKPTTKTP